MSTRAQAQTCGDGIIDDDAGEICDDGPLNGTYGNCNATCTDLLECGDGIINGPEVCDDGPLNGTYGFCNTTCTGVSQCGDAVMNPGEICDDGELNGTYGNCNATCTGVLECGDGITNGPEACDDGNVVGGDGCEPDCTVTPAGAMAVDSLNVFLESGGNVRLEWGSSCLATDTDYAVYAGALGSFTSHAPVACSTGGTTWTFTPAPGDVYFLVVPRNGVREGSYGMDGGSGERPPSAGACLPQKIGTCS